MSVCCPNRGFWKNARDYAKAVITWVRNGRPTRSEAEIKERWEICLNCENFRQIKGKPWRGRCGVCGCYLGRHAHKFIPGNKIAMKTERCPEGKWN